MWTVKTLSLGVLSILLLQCVVGTPTKYSSTNSAKSKHRSSFLEACPYYTDRVECTGDTQQDCFSNGCVWCPTDTSGAAYCIQNPNSGSQQCDNNIPDASKVDCAPDASDLSTQLEGECYMRDCNYCSSDTEGVPACFYNSANWTSTPQVLSDEAYRVDCAPNQQDDVENLCFERGCIWQSTNSDGAPYCYYPPNFGYSLVSSQRTATGYLAVLNRNNHPSLYGNDSQTVYVHVEFQTDSRLRVMITDDGDHWQVPINITTPLIQPSNPLYDVTFTAEPVFSFQVTRVATGTVIFDSSLGGFTISNQYNQIATILPSTNVYGIGENEQYTFRHNFDWTVYALYARDQPPAGTTNMYGVHPHYTVIEDDEGNTHSVLFLNSNAQEFQFTPAPGIVYRTIGGVLDIYFFLGPTPENSVQQYTEAVGRFPIPPYFSLGFHLCRYGYSEIANMEAAVNRTAFYGIPQDVQYGDIDIMDGNMDFTYDSVNFAGLPQYIQTLKSQGVNFFTILDPAIATGVTGYTPYDSGEEMNVWVKKSNGEDVVGQVWPANPVKFPDFTKENTTLWWADNIATFHNLLEWQGLWIDMNEPSNFITGDLNDNGCADNNLNFPPYKPATAGSTLSDKTICADHVQALGLHYDVHNLYGLSESIATLNAVRAATGHRSLVLTRSNFPSAGKHAAHWLGDNYSNYDNLKRSIIGVLQYNQFGIPMAGADICGFQDDSNAELCQRWQEVGAFYPFSRNHNTEGTVEQDPGVWGEAVANSSRDALLIRYTILPYMYTQFYYHYTEGNTVARALWHEFPADSNTYGVDEQFLLGPAWMVSPALYEDQTTVNAYFPDARWYSYYDGSEVTTVGQNVSLSVPSDFIPLHIRGGYIIPTQDPATHTNASRQNDIGFIVALDSSSSASGSMFYDDGYAIDTVESGDYFFANFSYSEGSFDYNVVNDGYSGMSDLSIGTVRILGESSRTISSVFVNGVQHKHFHVNENSKEIQITSIKVPANKNFNIKWH